MILADLNIILQNVVSDFELLIQERNVIIEYNHLPTIDANPVQLRQLFSNLISNAIKFCTDTPRIAITADVAELTQIEDLSQQGHHRYHRLTFHDNGIGFSKEYKKQIFSLFKRLNTREEYEGTGIGLAICKRIMDNHSGIIQASSNEGDGATFECFFPL